MLSADLHSSGGHQTDSTEPAQRPGRSSRTEDHDGGARSQPLFGGGEPVWEELGGAPGGGGSVALALDPSLAQSPIGGAVEHQAAESPSAIAEHGFQGGGGELPHRAELEHSFGTSFEGVKAHTDEHARDATEQLGAKAYAAGDRVAFGSPNPDKSLVAHELTHVLQHGEGPAAKSDAGGAGIETAGEPEAERVEAAVASGKPALAALDGGRAPARSGPALARRPALSKTAFGTGMTFSPHGFEKSYSYKLWDAPEIEVPVGAVPGLNLLVTPDVSVSAGGGVDWKKKGVTSRLGVEGSVGVGFGYGNSHLAELYGVMEARVNGGFTYERQKTNNRISNWDLNGGFTLGTNFAIGVKLGGGVVDCRFEFGHCEIGYLYGLAWQNGHFDKSQIGWTWGAQPQAFFGKVKSLIEKVKHILNLPKEAAKDAWNGMKGAVGAVGGVIKHIHLPHIHLPHINLPGPL